MTGLQELKDIYDKKGEKFIKNLFNNHITIIENLDASKFSFQKDIDGNLNFYKRDDRTPLNSIDRTFMIYYEKAIQYIESLDNINEIPSNWRFCFKYFVNNAPINITYDEIPTNNLVLTHIVVKSKSGKTVDVLDDIPLLKEWADKLQVAGPPVIYRGILKESQKRKLLDFLENNIEDIKEIFGTESFIKYVLKILNPGLKKTLLNSDLDKPIDSIVFKFTDPNSNEKETVSAKIVDPYFKKFNTLKFKSPRLTSDTYSIVLFDILEFIAKNPDVISGQVLSTEPDKRYLELICDIFNKYVEQNKNKFDDFDFNNPDFSKNKFFRVNVELINNPTTKSYIDSSEIFQNILKVFISSFRKKRKKTTDILSINIIKNLNSIIDKIKNITETPISGNFQTYEQYLKLKECNEILYSEEKEETIKEKTLIIKEKIDVKKSVEKGGKEVNIIVGRFQPFTKGHVKVFERLHKENGLPVLVLCTKGEKRSKEKNPFGKGIQNKLFESLKEEFDYLEDIIHIHGSVTPKKVLESVRPDFEPILWGAGSDRVDSFRSQLNINGRNLNLSEKFNLHSIDRDGVSATDVRKALVEDNMEAYNDAMPNSLHSYFNALQFVVNVNTNKIDNNFEN